MAALPERPFLSHSHRQRWDLLCTQPALHACPQVAGAGPEHPSKAGKGSGPGSLGSAPGEPFHCTEVQEGPQPSAASWLHGPSAPLSISAKGSLLLRANYPSISLGKDSADVCKISIH